MRHIFAMVLACGPLVQSCVKKSSSTPEAVVSAAEIRAAREIVTHLDYVPWSYKADGCHGRMMYMAMELAAQKIPSSAMFVFSKGKPFKIPDGSGYWGEFHVAPIFEVSPAKSRYTRYVIDPSFGGEAVMPFEKWIALMDATERYEMMAPGSVYLTNLNRDLVNKPMITNFEALPNFVEGEIEDACGILYQYIGEETALSDREKEEKRTRLTLRTAYLNQKLIEVGKLPAGTVLTCGETHLTQLAPSGRTLVRAESPLNGFERSACSLIKKRHIAPIAKQLFTYRAGNTDALQQECATLAAD